MAYLDSFWLIDASVNLFSLLQRFRIAVGRLRVYASFFLLEYLVKIKDRLYLPKIYPMETATVLSISIAVALVVITALALYTAFGPPAAELSDPFEDHED